MPGGWNAPEGFYSVKEAARLSGWSVAQLRRLDNRGIVRPSRIKQGTNYYRAYTNENVNRLKMLKHDKREREMAYIMVRLKELSKG